MRPGAVQLSIILSALLVFACRNAWADVGVDDYNRIRDLTGAGDYAAALEQHLWFHEESENSVGMGAVRLSYALIDWVELGELYPPARAALISLKEKDKVLLLSGKGRLTHFRDFASINQALGSQEETLDLFLALEKQFSDQAAIYYLYLEDYLFEREEYEVIARHIGNPSRKFDNLRYMRELSIASADRNNPLLLEALDRRYVAGVTRLLQFLMALDRAEEAIEIQKSALAYYPHEEISTAIP